METHTEHIDDLVEAYALGALDPMERTRVEAHIAECPPCKQQAYTAADTAQMLALLAAPVAPPQVCKLRVLEKVAREQWLASPTRRSRSIVSAPIWASVAAAVMLLVTGVWGMNKQQQLAQVQSQMVRTRSENTQMHSQLTSTQSEAAALRTQVAQYSKMDSMLASAEAIRPLKGEGELASAVAKTYMKPGSNHAVVVISGLKPLPAGKTYQVWVAREGVQQPVATFRPQQNDATHVEIAPPEPMDHYKWIMVTVEDAPGATQPSDTTVLFGDL